MNKNPKCPYCNSTNTFIEKKKVMEDFLVGKKLTNDDKSFWSKE